MAPKASKRKAAEPEPEKEPVSDAGSDKEPESKEEQKSARPAKKTKGGNDEGATATSIPATLKNDDGETYFPVSKARVEFFELRT